MITAISRWLTPPVFHDADKARRAAVLNVALLTALLLIGLVMVGNLLGGRTPTGVMVLDGTIVGVCLMFRWWMRRGHLTSAAVGFIVFSTVIITAVCAALGSLRTPTTAAFMLVVVMGGLLFDVTGLVVTTIACSASVLGLLIAEQNGWLPPPDARVTITQWFTYTTFFAWVGSLVAIALRLTRQALYRAEQESGERQRVSEIERAQRTLSEALQAATTTMTSTLDFELVLDRILVEVSRVVACDTAAVYQVEGATARAIRWHTVTNRPEPELSQLQFDVTTTRNFAELLETRQPVVIPDTQTWPGWIVVAAQAWIQSYVGVLIQSHGRIFGVLEVDSAVPNFYDQTTAATLRVFAAQAAIAMENARLYAEAQRHNEELEQRVFERTRELSAANDRLQELDRLKSKFVSDVSHELRTPVTSLSLYLELMNHGKAEKKAHYLEQATGQTARLRDLIEEVLDLSRLERQRTGLERHVLDLNDIVDQAITEQQPAAETAGLVLGRSGQIEPLQVQGDPGQLRRAIRNLLTNAIKYTRAGQVQIGLISDGRRAGVQVRDTGMGIAADDLPHVFERFYRGRQVAQLTTPGAGLGLAIVKEIVEAHGGSVEVESTLDVGSTFTLWLPAVIG